MFKIKLDKLKEYISKKTEGNNKKNIENLVVFLVILIITIITINSIWGKDENKNNDSKESKQLAVDVNNDMQISNNIEKETYNLEEKLEDILSKIEGVRRSKSYDYIFRN